MEIKNHNTLQLTSIFIFLLALFSFIRIVSALGDLWLDEIWSISIVASCRSFWDVFLIHHDNNHFLNSIYLYFVGQTQDGPPWINYRWLSLLSGVVTIITLFLISKKYGKFVSLLTVWFAGLSYPLILYSSEARGYSLTIMFSLLSYVFMQKASHKLRWAPIFWCMVILGFLSHLSFIYFFIALTLLFFSQQCDHFKLIRFITRSVSLFFIPMLFVGILYLFHVDEMVFGGGTKHATQAVIYKLVMLILGFPKTGAISILGFIFFWVVILFTLLWGSEKFNGEQKGQWFLVICSIGISFIFAFSSEIIYFRYLLLWTPFFYLLLSYFLKILIKKHAIGKYICIIFILVFTFGNSFRVMHLMTEGRGHYFEAVKTIASSSKKREVFIGSNHDFRNGVMVDYYKRFLDNPKRINYIRRVDWPHTGPDWVLILDYNFYKEPQEFRVDTRGNRYLFFKRFLASGESGWIWDLYKNENLI